MFGAFLTKLRAIVEAAAAAIFMLFLLVVGPFWLMVSRHLDSDGRHDRPALRGV
jgi:hypothetical protein